MVKFLIIFRIHKKQCKYYLKDSVLDAKNIYK